MVNAAFRIEYLGNKINAVVSDEHTFGTDAVLLARFSSAKRKDVCCDLGTGCGIIPLLLLREEMNETITAVEIQENACRQVEEAIELNHLEGRLQVINCDLREYEKNLPMGKFSLVTFNPPYFSKESGQASPDESTRIARHEIMSDIFEGAKCASFILKFGGRFCVCHRPERLCDVFQAMRENGIEPKRMTFCRRNKKTKPFLVLVEGKKGGKCGLKVEDEIILADENGAYLDGIYGDYKEK